MISSEDGGDNDDGSDGIGDDNDGGDVGGLEKTLMLTGIGGRRKRGRHRMR